MQIEHTTTIDAPIDRLWELTLDVESWPEHTPSMTSVERLDTGPIEVGSEARIKQPGQRTRVWTVTALEPRKHFAWSTNALGTVMTGGHHMSEDPDGRTTSRLTVDIDGALAPLVGFLLRRPIRKAIEQENDGFKSWAEGAVTEAPVTA